VKKHILTSLFFITGLFIIFELFFGFVLPASEWPRGVILDSSIRRFDSKSFTEGKFTYGRYCQGGFSWSINNGGWNSIFDYQNKIDREMPMIAILGDSYIEGFYSNVHEHIDVFLTEEFEDSISFYTFAMSGGYLAQYIALMKYEVDQYTPDAYVVFLNSSDVLKSIRELGGKHSYYFQYSLDSLGVYNEVVALSVTRSKYKDLLLRSAFVRYLRANAQVSLFGGGLADENANQPEPEVVASVEVEISSDLKNAAEFLLSELNSFGKPVLIVADCPKMWIYEGGVEEAFDDVIALREAIDSFPHVTMVELSSYYVSEYAENDQVFSVEGNPHWDSYANLFIAETIAPFVSELLLNNASLGY